MKNVPGEIGNYKRKNYTPCFSTGFLILFACRNLALALLMR